MRALAKNARTIYFKTYQGEQQIVDDDGNKTGEYEITYSELIQAKMNVSAARGTADQDMFGISTDYTKSAVTCDLDCEMDENSIVWVDASTDEDYDYVVVQKAKSLNSITYALKEVKVSGDPRV